MAKTIDFDTLSIDEVARRYPHCNAYTCTDEDGNVRAKYIKEDGQWKDITAEVQRQAQLEQELTEAHKELERALRLRDKLTAKEAAQ